MLLDTSFKAAPDSDPTPWRSLDDVLAPDFDDLAGLATSSSAHGASTPTFLI